MHYLDHASGSPLRPRCRLAMEPWLAAEGVGNPASAHAAGRRARRAISEAREALAGALGASPRDLLFTSGGTEADNLALAGVWHASGGQSGGRRRLVVSAIEHPAVLETARWLAGQGAEVTLLPVGVRGRVDPEVLAAALGPEVLLVSVMAVNNETGVVQPVAELAELAHRAGALFHCDAVQALGRIPLDLPAWGVDLASLSGHKPGGPMGVGALWVRPGTPLARQSHGGTQQGGRRAGSEPVAAIVGLGAAAGALSAEERQRLGQLDRRLRAGLAAIPGLVAVGDPEHLAPGIVCLAAPGMDGDTLVMALDQAGICASSGAACASGARQPSPVLTAMGLSGELVQGELRLSLGWSSQDEDVTAVLAALPRILADARAAREEMRG